MVKAERLADVKKVWFQFVENEEQKGKICFSTSELKLNEWSL